MPANKETPMPPRKPDVPDTLTDQDPAHMTDAELAAATSDAAVEAGTIVRLAVGHPYNELVLHDVDVDGKPLTVTADGTDVPVEHEDAVRKAAKDAGVPIRKVR